MDPHATDFIRGKIFKFSQIDFEKSYLVSDEAFVHAEQNSSFLGERQVKNMSAPPSIKNPRPEQTLEAVKKIHRIVGKDPAIILDIKTASNLLVLNMHLFEYLSSHFPQEREGFRAELEKLSVFTIEILLLHQPSTYRELEKLLHEDDAIDWISVAGRHFTEKGDIRQHPCFVPINSPEEINSLLDTPEVRPYFLMNKGNRSLLAYHSETHDLVALEINLTKSGKFFYQTAQRKVFLANTLEELVSKLQGEGIIPKEIKLSPISKSSKTASAVKIQAVFRGWKTRQAALLPSQILPFLMNNLIDNSNAPDLARALCREINEMTLNPKAFKGKSIRIEKVRKTYPFPILTGKNNAVTEMLTVPLNCWVEMPEDGKTIKLTLVPYQSFINKGTTKEVHKAQKFEISLRLNLRRREISYSPGINFEIIGKTPNEKRAVKAEVLKSLKIQKAILDKLGPRIKVVQLPQEHLPLKDFPVETFVMEQEWYHADLGHALKRPIPLNLKGDQEYTLTSRERIQILLDSAISLKAIHEEGYVHRDIKPANILVKVNQGGVEGYLADFDFACEIGPTSTTSPYYYWDHCSGEGVVTPFSDIYGLAITLGETMLPQFTTIYPLSTFLEKEPIRKGFLVSSFKAHLEAKYGERNAALNSIFSSSIISIEELKEKISILISKHTDEDGLSKEQLLSLAQELNAMEKSYYLILEILQTNKELHALIKYDVTMRGLLTSPHKNKRQEGIEILKSKFPLLTMEPLIQALLEIQSLLPNHPPEL